LVELLEFGCTAALALDVVDRGFLAFDMVRLGAAALAAVAQAVLDRELLVADGAFPLEARLDGRALGREPAALGLEVRVASSRIGLRPQRQAAQHHQRGENGMFHVSRVSTMRRS